MEIWWITATIILSAAVIFLLIYIISQRHSIREIADELEEKLKTDTNTLISISSGDSAVRSLAERINDQLIILRKKQLQLENGDAELKSAITNVSHDLRTPLTAICGYLELLEKEDHTDNSRRYLSVIKERTNAMRGLTEELFRYSVISGNADEQSPEKLCLNDVLEQNLAGFYGVLTMRKISPDISIPEEKIIRELDRAALCRIFENIIGNAAKYSDGDLRVTLTADGSISFSNTAKKLSRVQAERLFDRFYTVDTPGSAGASTGLGLSIAKLLTEKMGGSISADYSDSRLCVTVSFPEKQA